MSKLCLYFVWSPSFLNTTFTFVGMDFIRAAQLATGILFGLSTMMTVDALKGLGLGTSWPVVILEECLGSLSCWKLKSTSPGSTHAATHYDVTSAILDSCFGVRVPWKNKDVLLLCHCSPSLPHFAASPCLLSMAVTLLMLQQVM